MPPLFVLLLPVACTPSGEDAGGLALTWRLHPDPPTVGPVAVSVIVSDPDWSPRNGATVIVYGMRDSVTLARDTARGTGAGRYVTDDFVFEVAGDWTLEARVHTTDGRSGVFRKTVEVTAEER